MHLVHIFLYYIFITNLSSAEYLHDGYQSDGSTASVCSITSFDSRTLPSDSGYGSDWTPNIRQLFDQDFVFQNPKTFKICCNVNKYNICRLIIKIENKIYLFVGSRAGTPNRREEGFSVRRSGNLPAELPKIDNISIETKPTSNKPVTQKIEEPTQSEAEPERSTHLAAGPERIIGKHLSLEVPSKGEHRVGFDNDFMCAPKIIIYIFCSREYFR